jgi:hypothetical protein
MEVCFLARQLTIGVFAELTVALNWLETINVRVNADSCGIVAFAGTITAVVLSGKEARESRCC